MGCASLIQDYLGSSCLKRQTGRLCACVRLALLLRLCSDCSTAECGNEVVTAEGAGGRVELSQSVVYEVRGDSRVGGGHKP